MKPRIDAQAPMKPSGQRRTDCSKPLPSLSASAKGGRVTAAQSLQKAAALERLHRSRRGKPRNQPAKAKASIAAKIATLESLLEWGDKSALARLCGASVRQVGRWIAGVDMPPSTALAHIDDYLRRAARRALAKASTSA